jgi:lysophospholipase L1-like esterase
MKVRSAPLLLAAALLGAAATVLAAAPAHAVTAINYVALGDSYSAGVGAGGYDISSGLCSRSPRSYAPLWATSHAASSFGFVACGGATTDDVLNNQLGGLNAATTLVTITIGGNDAGFVDVVTTCILGTDGGCQFAVNLAKGYATTILPAKLAHLYTVIRTRAPNARLIVLGYPRLFELTTWCTVFGLDLTKRTALNVAADTLAGVVATQAQNTGATYIDVRGVFAGHGICGSDPWINPTTWPITDSYHPTATGYQYGYLPALVGVTG